MSSQFGSHTDHADRICCPHCGKTGSIIWEEGRESEGSRKDLIRIEGDFYERLASKAPYPIEIVCNSCGTSQPEKMN